MKVLMVTMSLGIGGAETHIVELSKALARVGVSVTVASAGGVYEAALEEAGIPHVTLPLNRKDPISVLRARSGLRKLILRERFDIVHAHARIPAAVCGTLKRSLGFRFVTTCHLDFKVTPLWRRLTNWGEYTFAVSEDLKGYLLRHYSVNPAHIGVIVNGIDTEAFSPSADGTALRVALSRDGRPIVLHISRLSASTTVCANALIDAVAHLEGRVSLVLVGDGEKRALVQAHADAVNAALGFEAVTLAGARTNIAEYIAASDICVAPSRAAMEAMAIGKPTILSGSQGHGGLFGKALAPLAMASNFCFRGEALPTPEILAAAIREVLALSPEERAALGQRGRAFIESRYSVSHMMQAQLAVYEKLAALGRRTDVLICGYYGYGNAGDETILASLVDGIRRRAPELGLCVMSSHPRKTASYLMVDAVNRFHPLAVFRAMKRSSLFLFGGGNLLQDKTSRRSLSYYCYMIRKAKKLGASVMVYANGIGPLRNEKSERRVREALSLADSLSFREKSSFMRVGALLPEKQIRLTFDPAILLRPAIEGVTRENRFLLVPKKVGILTEEVLVRLIRKMRERFALEPMLLSLYNAQDKELCRAVAAKTGAELLSPCDAEATVSLFSRARFAFSSRLHGMIYATSAACPVISYSDDGKLSSYLEYIGLGGFCGTPCAANPEETAEELVSLAARLLQEEEGIRRTITAGLPMWRTLAEYEFSEVVRAARKAAEEKKRG